MKSFLRNDRGMVGLISVMLMAVVVVTTLSSIYIYTVNRAKYHKRVKDAYTYINSMESIAKTLYSSYAAYQAGGGACPSGTHYVAMNNNGTDKMDLCWPDTNYTYGGSQHAVCATSGYSADTSGDTVCLFENGTTKVGTAASMGVTVTSNFDQELNKWYARLDQFFESTVVETSLNVATSFNHLPKEPSFSQWIINSAHAQINAFGDSTGENSPPVVTLTPLELCMASLSHLYCGIGETQPSCDAASGATLCPTGATRGANGCCGVIVALNYPPGGEGGGGFAVIPTPTPTPPPHQGGGPSPSPTPMSPPPTATPTPAAVVHYPPVIPMPVAGTPSGSPSEHTFSSGATVSCSSQATVTDINNTGYATNGCIIGMNSIAVKNQLVLTFDQANAAALSTGPNTSHVPAQSFYFLPVQ